MIMAAILCGFVLFLAGFCAGCLVVGRRYRLALEDRDAEAKRHTEMVSGYMMKGVDFNQSILDILRVQGQQPRSVTIDWTLLTQAANGAGFTLVKAEPRATERAH